VGVLETTPVFRYRDALDLPRSESFDANPDLPLSVCVEGPGGQREFQRSTPEFLADPDNVGLFSSFAEDTIVYPPAFFVSARNAVVVGARTILSGSGFFFNDDSIRGGAQQREFINEFAATYSLIEETGLELVDKDGGFRLNIGSRKREQIEGTTVVLGSAEPSNYGSWIFRVVPKFQTLRWAAPKEQLRYLVWCEIPAFQEYLEFLDVPEDRIIRLYPNDCIYELERAVVPSMRNNQAFLDPESVALFAEIRDKLGKRQEQGTRIYISRVGQSQRGHPRAMLNESELVERLVKMGFQIVEPEALSVAEQISTFSSAEMVVGPSGSGMFNVVYCHPGTKVIDIESEPHWIHAHRCLLASCGLRYGIFVGATLDQDFSLYHKPWRVNIDALVSRIEAWS
jgi:capsular polysaccharide biosynthesis protein